jgi:hypothetical protein
LEIIKKNAEKFETQQKVLELALEGLEENSKMPPELTLEQKIWLLTGSINSMCYVQKDDLKILMETANLEQYKDYVIQNKPLECMVELFHQKSLQECSLKEVMDGLTIVLRTSHLFDSIDYKDDGDYYLLILSHSLGFNNSKIRLVNLESLFKTCGLNHESKISEKTIFMKVFKDK